MSAILEIRGLRKDFGGVTALAGVDLTVEEGEILGVVGPNGSGKTTLFNVVTGVHKPTAGSVAWRGCDITGISSHHSLARRHRLHVPAGHGVSRSRRVGERAHRDRAYA